VTAALNHDALDAAHIAGICDNELAGPRWSEAARAELYEISWAARGVLSGEPTQDELDERLTAWAETVDSGTFPRISDAELVAHSLDQRRFNRVMGRAS
jgi:hypothetical protein